MIGYFDLVEIEPLENQVEELQDSLRILVEDFDYTN
jgi:hypothetical protein